MSDREKAAKAVLASVGEVALEYFLRRLRGQRPRLKLRLSWEGDDASNDQQDHRSAAHTGAAPPS
jgi:hypothetical protein